MSDLSYFSSPLTHLEYYCPPGHSNQTLCPAGHYCPPQTQNPIRCPHSHYCPIGSSKPILCPLGSFCPPQSQLPLWCPDGTYAPPDSSNSSRSSEAEACLPCPAGTHGTDPTKQYCYPCTPGYVCLGRTSLARPTDRSLHGGYECPKGFYCPESSVEEIPCPTGKFGPDLRQSNITQCLPCPEGYYNHLRGQEACWNCPASAFSGNNSNIDCSFFVYIYFIQNFKFRIILYKKKEVCGKITK